MDKYYDGSSVDVDCDAEVQAAARRGLSLRPSTSEARNQIADRVRSITAARDGDRGTPSESFGSYFIEIIIPALIVASPFTYTLVVVNKDASPLAFLRLAFQMLFIMPISFVTYWAMVRRGRIRYFRPQDALRMG